VKAPALQATSSGVRIAYDILGSGDPVVLVHGLGYARWGWDPVVEPLAERFQLILFDNRGIGDSEVPAGPYTAAAMSEDVAAVLDTVGLERAHVVGTSLGGMVAQELAIRRPERVERLALLSPAGVPSRGGLLGHVVPLLATLRATGPALAAALARDAAAAGPASLLRGARYAVRTDLRRELNAVAAPTLLLWGERDHVVPVSLAEEWCRELGTARVLVLPGAGHVPMFDAPSEVAEALLRFLEEVEDEPRDAAGR
jgi:pimeloyl-ACP methyl ester carboxylesterase